MAFAAMAGSLDEIAPAIPYPLCRDRGEGRSSKSRSFHKPTARRIEKERASILRRPALDRRQNAQESDEIGDVLQRHALIGRIGEGRIEVLTIPGHARQKGVGDVDRAPAADPVSGIAGYIGRIERAEWRLELEAAAEPSGSCCAGEFWHDCSRRRKRRSARGGVAGQTGAPLARRIARVRGRRAHASRRRPQRRRRRGRKPLRFIQTASSASAALGLVELVTAAAILEHGGSELLNVASRFPASAGTPSGTWRTGR